MLRLHHELAQNGVVETEIVFDVGEIYEESLLQNAHFIIDQWDKETLTSEQMEIMEELKNIEENQYPFEILQ